MTAAELTGLWGFCGPCERWRHADTWGEPPACPVCGARPALIERLEGDHTVLSLELEVAVGPVGSRRFLSDSVEG